jgi:hypothetical protein
VRSQNSNVFGTESGDDESSRASNSLVPPNLLSNNLSANYFRDSKRT